MADTTVPGRAAAGESGRLGALGRALPWRRIRRSHRLLVGVAMLAVVVFAALFADQLATYPPYKLNVGPRLSAPNARHALGTDLYGRDQWSRLLVGAQVSLQAGAGVALAAWLIGMPLGLAAGYRGGWLDEAISRALELIFAFPWLLIALVLAAIFGPSLNTALASLVIVYAPIVARLTRSVALSEREREYVQAARAIGVPGWRIALRHLAPNVMSPVVVLITSVMAYAVLAEASLSYLGLGAQPPTASWGRMLTENGQFFATAPHLALFPGIAISWLVLALNLLGDGMRDVLDPRHARIGG